ncbi:MAG: isochorismatase family protein [Candidatus Sungbacteria bacterium]|nr:isochorismatase family protein [Candidatus Sungbacteria bacterium]
MTEKAFFDPKKTAFIIVDMQRDFCRGGALAVPEADRLIKPINRLKRLFQSQGALVMASRCWHPQESVHFEDFAVHGVQNTKGAEFNPGLDLEGVMLISKGMDPAEQGFSVFDGRSENGNPFDAILEWNKIETVLFGGVALEYCVASSVRDARGKGYRVVLVEDAVRAFDPKKRIDTLYEMVHGDVELVQCSEVIKKFFPKPKK